jgi:cell division protein FtsI (penicillin-binding protein 3)
LLALVALRLVWVQVVMAGELTAKAKAQRLRDIEVPPRRGTIYDREGEPLAVSVEARTIFANPYQVKDKAATAATLAQVLGGEAKTYEQRLSRKGGFVYIERKVDKERADTLENLKLEGIGFLEDSRRMYPAGDAGGQVLGFVGVDDNGLSGTERRYDDVLAGKPGVLLAELDRRGRPIPGGVIKRTEPVDGADVVLTIDKDIQFEAQAALAKAVKERGASSGSVVVMNPRNGEIYAIASYPYFDPNSFKSADPRAFRLKAVSDAYEPGSTIKCLTAASTFEAGKLKPDTMITLPPTLHIAGRTIHESHGRGTVRWPIRKIITESSNIGAVKLGMTLGVKRLYRCFSGFGLTEATGVDLPGEAVGWMPPADQWSALSMGNIPFGQGVSTTPLQLSRAISAIANGGMLPTPHILLSLPEQADRKLVWPSRSAISTSAANVTSEIMAEVVTEGTGKAAAVKGYSVAGKTGTAQVALPNGRGYAKGSYNSSFIGYLPVEDPQVLVCVVIYQPTHGYYGGQVAAPVFSEIAGFAVDHLRILPPAKPAASGEASAVVGTAGKRGTKSDEASRNSAVTVP